MNVITCAAQSFKKGRTVVRPYIAAVLVLVMGISVADAYSGRRAVLYARGQVMLQENLSHARQDCSAAAWRLVRDLWPELTVTKWFHRTTASAMGSWPWPPVMSLADTMFGDLLFANGKKGDPRTWSPAEQFKISHVMLRWDQRGIAVHASSSRGFSKTTIAPYWTLRINVAIRPPY